MGLDRRTAAGAAVAHAALDLPEIAQSETVAAYMSVGTEPATGQLLATLLARGTRVLVPLLCPDRDLDWVQLHDPDQTIDGPAGVPEPVGPRLGVEAIASADTVIVPGLAVDEQGVRLGRGGGSYDRALARVSAATPVIALLYDDEVLPVVPTEAHDRAVDVAVTPSRVWRFSMDQP